MKKNKSQKKILAGVLSAALVIAIGVGATISYLTDTTVSRVNNFTYPGDGELIDAMITETKWDGIIDYTYNADGSVKDPVYSWNADGTPVTVRPAGTNYGIDKSKNLLPGISADKDPVVTNTGSISDIWAATKMTFVYSSSAAAGKAGKTLSDTDLQAVLDVLDLDYNVSAAADGWTRKAGETASSLSQTFYYNGMLEKAAGTAAGVVGDTSKPLFTRVKIKDEANKTQMDKLAAFGGFAIFIEGFAVQSDAAANQADWLSKAGTLVNFVNTPTADTAGSGYTPS